MDIITNSVFATITGAAIAIASLFGLNPSEQVSTTQTSNTIVSVCGSAGLLPSDVAPEC